MYHLYILLAKIYFKVLAYFFKVWDTVSLLNFKNYFYTYLDTSPY